MPLFVNKELKGRLIEEDININAKYAKAQFNGVLQGIMHLNIVLSDKEITDSENISDCNQLIIEAICEYEHNGNLPEYEYPISDDLTLLNSLQSGRLAETPVSIDLYGTVAKVFDETGWMRFGLIQEGTMTVSGDKDN